MTVAAIATVTAWPAVANAQRVCWPGVTVPPVEIPAITIPAREIPARQITIPAIPGRVAPTIPTITVPAITIPAVSIPAFTVPGYTVPERCFDSKKDALPPSKTSVRVRNYHRIDSNFSLALSVAYWRQTGPSSLVPEHSAEGFGESTAAGFAVSAKGDDVASSPFGAVAAGVDTWGSPVAAPVHPVRIVSSTAIANARPEPSLMSVSFAHPAVVGRIRHHVEP